MAERQSALTSVLDIVSRMLRVEPLDSLLNRIAEIISEDCGIQYVLVGLRDEDTGLFCERLMHGYPEDKLRNWEKKCYTLEQMRKECTDARRIAPRGYLIKPLEEGLHEKKHLWYISDPGKAYSERKHPNDWHPLDWITFMMTGKQGDWIGWIEIIEPVNGMLPTSEEISKMQVLCDLAAIAIENAKLYDKILSAGRETELYLDLIMHDIGNRLTPLVIYHERMMSNEALDSETRKTLESTVSISSSMEKLVDNVRTLSRLKRMNTLSMKRVDLADVINRNIADVVSEHSRKRIEVTMKVPETGPAYIMADELVHSIFLNLLDNSMKFSKGETIHVDVRIVDVGEKWRVEVEDDGRGIPDARKQSVFLRFSEQDEGDRQGTGIGLYLAWNLVKRYNGTISVRDRVEGDSSKGACFFIDFPKLLTKGK